MIKETDINTNRRAFMCHTDHVSMIYSTKAASMSLNEAIIQLTVLLENINHIFSISVKLVAEGMNWGIIIEYNQFKHNIKVNFWADHIKSNYKLSQWVPIPLYLGRFHLNINM